MNIRYKKYGRREDPRYLFKHILMQLVVGFLFLAGLTLTLFLLLLTAVFSPLAVLIHRLKFRNRVQAVNGRRPDNHASRNPSVIEGKYKVIDK